MILDLAHNARMIHAITTMTSFNLFSRGMHIDRLTKAIELGGRIDPDSVEDRSLADDIRTFRMLALQLERARAQLIDNAMPRFLLIEPEHPKALSHFPTASGRR